MAYWLEGAGVVTMGLAANGVGTWDFALGVKEVTSCANVEIPTDWQVSAPPKRRNPPFRRVLWK